MTMLQGEEESCTIYGPNTLLLPIFRGLRVRVGIHTGLAEEVEINPVTRRVVYGGQARSGHLRTLIPHDGLADRGGPLVEVANGNRGVVALSGPVDPH